MKRILFFLTALLLVLSACKDENFNITYISQTQVSAGSSIADVIIIVEDETYYGGRHSTVEEAGVFLSTTSDNPTEKDEKRSVVITEQQNSASYYKFTISGLQANTTYYALPFVANSLGMITGDIISFTTTGTATVTTKAATQITASSAILNANVQLVGNNVNLEKRGFLISTTTNPTIESTNISNWAEVGKVGDYSVQFTNLSDNTTYYFRGYVVVDSEYLYGNTLSFKTAILENTISMTLHDVTDITSTTAHITGTLAIGKDIVGQMTECGFIFTTDNNPTFNSYPYRYVYCNSQNNSNFSSWVGTANINGTVTLLSPNTRYYYRMYYQLGGQYYYDNTIKSFYTLPDGETIYTVSEIMNVYNSLNVSQGSSSADTYTVRGYVTRWKSGYPDYQNADFYIDDAPNGSTSLLQCFRLVGETETDKRTLIVGDYIEARDCKLYNYNGTAELQGGSFTVIKAAKSQSVADFVGTYSLSAYNVNLQKYESWDNVEINTCTNSSTNSEWIYVYGLNGGYDYAVGEYDATNDVLRLYAGVTFTSATYNLDGKGDTLFVSYFSPINCDKSGLDNWHVVSDGNSYNNGGEAWLRFTSSGKLELGAASFADSNGQYANGYNFITYYAESNNFYSWDYAFIEVVLTKTSSSVSSTPAKLRQATRWHAPMLMPNRQNQRTIPQRRR